jgi:hypothetical protein
MANLNDSSAEPAPADNPDEETPAVVEAAADDDLAGLTAEKFVESWDQLSTRAREAGVRPVKVLLGTYASKFFSAVEGLLEGIEGKRDGPRK